MVKAFCECLFFVKFELFWYYAVVVGPSVGSHLVLVPASYGPGRAVAADGSV